MRPLSAKTSRPRGQAACLGRGAEVAGCRVVVANKPQDAALRFLQQTHPDSKDLLSVSTSKRHRYDQEPPPVDLADIGEPRADAWHRNGSAVQRVAPRKGARLGLADFVDAIARPVAAFVMRSLPCFVAGAFAYALNPAKARTAVQGCIIMSMAEPRKLWLTHYASLHQREIIASASCADQADFA